MHFFLKLLIFVLVVEKLKQATAGHQDCIQSSTFHSRMQECESAHNAALKKEWDELSRVKTELEQLKKEKAAAETALVDEQRRRVANTKDLQDKLNEDTERSNSLEHQLDELKNKPGLWLAELKEINDELSGEFLL